MSVIALLNYEESALRIYQKTSTVSIISEQPSYDKNIQSEGIKILILCIKMLFQDVSFLVCK